MEVEVTATPVEGGSTGTLTSADPGKSGAPAVGSVGTGAPPVPAKEDDTSARFAALARKERMILQRRAEHQRMQSQLQEDRASLSAREVRLREFEAARQDPFSALEKLGYSYDDLTKIRMNKGKETPDMEVRKMRMEMDAWKQAQQKEREEMQRQAQVQTQQQQQQSVQDYKEHIGRFLQQKGDQFDLVATTNNVEGVFSTIQEYYNRTGKIMELEEAAKLTEEFLEENFDNLYSKSKKLSSKYQRAAAAEKSESRQDGVPEGVRITQSKNITNEMSGMIQVPGLMDEASEQERVQRAMRALG